MKSVRASIIVAFTVALILLSVDCARTMSTNIETSIDDFVLANELKKIADIAGVDERATIVEDLIIDAPGGGISAFQLSFSAPKNRQYAEYIALMGRDKAIFIEKAREGSQVSTNAGDVTMAELASAIGSLSLADLCVGLTGKDIDIQLESVQAGERLASVYKQRVFTLSNGKLTEIGNNKLIVATIPSKKLLVNDLSFLNIILLSNAYSCDQL